MVAPVRFLAIKRGGPIVIVLLVTGLLSYLIMASRPSVEITSPPERTWPVETISAEERNIKPSLQLFGEVVASRKAELRALVAGPIVEVGPNFYEGGILKKGDLLVRVDSFDYKALLAEKKAMLVEAEASLQIQKRDLARTQELFDENNTSEQALDNARLTVVNQEASLALIKIAVDKASHDLRDVSLYAPYDGVLANVTGDLGKQLNVGDKVADIVNTGKLEARFTLSNKQFGRIREAEDTIVGRPATVGWNVGDRTLKFAATIERVGAEIDSTAGGIDVFAAIEPTPDITGLRPGAFVSVVVQDREYEGVMRAPESALYDNQTIYIVEGERLVEKQVELLGYDGSQIIFRSVGPDKIADGDLIVTTQLREAGSGLKVRLR